MPHCWRWQIEAVTQPTPAGRAFSHRDGLRYGLLGLPLAFVALPLYVLLPNHYARAYGVPLATLGAVLLGARLFDAVIDPMLGRLTDRLYARSTTAVLAFGSIAALVLLIGFALLFFPQWLIDTSQPRTLLTFTTALLVWTYAGYSALSVAYQSWGALLGGDEAQRSRVVGWRESFGLVGVLLASIVPVVAGLPVMLGVFSVSLIGGLWLWSRAPRPQHSISTNSSLAAVTSGAVPSPWQRPAFRRLLIVFMLNGIASAIPATLVLFFVQDRLQASAALAPAFLGVYFVCAALSVPLWLRLVPRFGLARTWLLGMVLAIAVFAWANLLGAGDSLPFIVVCALSGATLGADLVLPSALLAGVIADADADADANSHATQATPATGTRLAGACFGWWNFATKLNLALAAGLALPLLGLAGYVPGTRNPDALHALSLAYCLLPCALKFIAALTLWRLLLRPSTLVKVPL